MFATANEESKKLANNWCCQLMDAAYFNSEGVPTIFNYDDFQNAWQKKRSHLFFDKSLKVQFVWPVNALNAWLEVEKNFERLRSSSVIHMITGSVGQNTTATKQSGGATSTISTSHLSLSRTLPKGIKSDTKPLAFKTDKIGVYIFPTFIAVEHSNQIKVSSLFKTKLTRESKLMVGKAPKDSEVIGQSWKYVNVSGRNKGQPDKRRADNELLDNYKVDALNIRLDKNTEEVFEFRFSNAIRNQSFYAMFSVYMFALLAGEMNEDDADLESNNSPVSASLGEPTHVLVTSGIVSSGEDCTNNPTETDIKNTVEALCSLNDGDFAWMRLHLGKDEFMQSSILKEKEFSLSYGDGKNYFFEAKRNLHKDEILSIFFAFAKNDLSWKDRIEWDAPEWFKKFKK